MKTLGIIGGVGPQTTAEVYLSVIERIKKNNHEVYPPITIYNLPFPFAIEEEAIVEGRNAEKMLPYLLEAARVLTRSGAEIGILPCNTLHAFIQPIRAAASFPFLSILEETVLELERSKARKVGVLATATTIKSDLYGKALEQSGIQSIIPSAAEQDTLNRLILDLLQGAKDYSAEERLQNICRSLERRGADAILLACTDLQLAATGITCSVPILDTTELLVAAAVREMTK